MKRVALLLLMGLCIGIATYAQDSLSLQFSKEGTFKIVQFTDTHYKWGKSASDKAIECMDEVLKAEQPNLVVFTGDQVYSKGVAQSLSVLFKTVSKHKVPFVALFGNHDEQFECSRSEMYDLARSMPYNIQPPRGDSDSPDYVLALSSSDGTHIASLVYCLDSRVVTRLPDAGKYDWLSFDQVNWYRQQSRAYVEANGGEPLPSVAFFHIPLPEFAEAANDDKRVLIGTKGENVCSPHLNSGFFTAVREQGDVMGIFCGHDHDNDFAVAYREVLLAYGRFSGGNTVYNHIKLNGARVIELKEGERSFDTWIRLRGGEVIDKVNFPSDFLKKKKSANEKRSDRPIEVEEEKEAEEEE